MTMAAHTKSQLYSKLRIWASFLFQHAKLELKKSKRKDYYKILGVDKGANEDEIKKAYRKRALVHHPG